MSPEQAKGKNVDKRTDIWAFGVVLFEMLSGERLFKGDDISEILAGVIKEKPDLRGVPERVKPLLEKCLEKDPGKRLRDIGDMELLLTAPSAAQPPPPMLGGRAIAVLALLSIAAIAIALWAPWRVEKTADRPLVRLDVDLGSEVSLTGLGPSVILSPDGSRFAYISGTPGKLFTRRFSETKVTELSGTEGARQAFFSPDGQWLAFVTDPSTKLNKISIEGGAIVPIPIAELPTFAGGAWSEDGSIIAAIAVTKGLVRIPSGGGEPVSITDLAVKKEIVHGHPQVLPGGKAVLFGSAGPSNQGSTEVVTLADGKRKMVLPGVHARYAPTGDGVGHLLYNSGNTLFAVPFDLDRLETRGNPLPILDDVKANDSIGYSEYDVSAAGSGTLVYRRSSTRGNNLSIIQWLDASGKKTPLRNEAAPYRDVHISPDGRRVAFATGIALTAEVWIYDLQRDTPTRLASGPGLGVPIWTPDGRHLVFYDVSKKGLVSVPADGSSQPELFLETKGISSVGSFTKDGSRLAYNEIQGSTPQIFTVSIEEKDGHLMAGKPEQFLKSQSFNTMPALSSDGRWVAYVSTESGPPEVYVRPYPSPASGQGGKWPISNGGGTHPVWSPNGRELLYQSENRIMAVSFTTQGAAFVPDKPRVWIPKLDGSGWDVSADGKGIAVVSRLETQEAGPQDHGVTMLFNFFDELRRRVPLK